MEARCTVPGVCARVVCPLPVPEGERFGDAEDGPLAGRRRPRMNATVRPLDSTMNGSGLPSLS
jgi:hypothetical protein